ncbi:hypothetical protein EON82_03380 [bacterium]|nr:MAG: hypothetical protein EON82_03380 [bacterium]
MPFPLLCAIHGGFYLLTGLWPLVHMPSFLAVTGPKTDLWLVRTVGALVVAMSIAFLVAMREPSHASIVALGIAAPAAFIAIDFVYVAKRTIGKVYLLDALAEGILILGWLSHLLTR